MTLCILCFLQQERVDIEEKYANLQEEAAGKTKKLKKVWNMLMSAKSEVYINYIENSQFCLAQLLLSSESTFTSKHYMLAVWEQMLSSGNFLLKINHSLEMYVEELGALELAKMG